MCLFNKKEVRFANKPLWLSPQLIIAIVLILASVVLASQSWAGEAVHIDEESSVPVLELTCTDTSQTTSTVTHSSALLMNTHIEAQVYGLVSTVNITQNFKNTTDDWVHGRYVFPLPDGAAVDAMQFKVGDRIIKGVIKEKQEAKAIFEEAKKSGKKAVLLEQQRPNLFTMRLANIPAQATVEAKISYVQKARFDQGQFSLRFPATFTPRYDPAGTVEQGVFASVKQKVKSKLNKPESNTFSFDMKLVAGFDLQALNSEGYAINSRTKKEVTTVQLKNKREPMNRDLVVQWSPQQKGQADVAVFNQKIGDDYYALLMLTPLSTTSKINQAREIVFIVDSSGSMSGESMRQAKDSLLKGLQYLKPNDRFNIIDFDSETSHLFTQTQLASAKNISQAEHFIISLEADGGTEMYPALDEALTMLDNNSPAFKQIVFITDGSVYNEDALFGLISQRLNKARVFTVGIGSAPNAYFMRKAAQFGRGSYVLINDMQQVSEKISGLFEKISSPIAVDLELNFPEGQVVEMYPSVIPDLYAGEPVVVLAHSNKPLDQFSLQQRTGTSTKTIKVDSEGDYFSENIDALWARAKVESIMDQLHAGKIGGDEAKQTVVPLALNHHLVTQYTSLIAVEKKISRPKNANAKNTQVKNLMPLGNTMDIPFPATATSATMKFILALMMLLLSAGLLFSARLSNENFNKQAA